MPAYPLLLFLRYGHAVQQARAGLRLPGIGGLQPHPRDPRRERGLYRHLSRGHGGGDDGARRSAGDLITAVILPRPVEGKQIYRKVRDRASYAFALCSVAAVVQMDGGTIAAAALAFGGLAHKPWRDETVEALLVGEKPSAQLFGRAADQLLAEAQGHGSNDFKIPLTRRVMISVLQEATETGAAA